MGDRAPAPVSLDPLVRRWCRLGLALVALWMAAFVAIPALQRLPGMALAVQALLDSGIEVGALYYTGVEKVAEAEAAVHRAARPPAQ